MKFLCSELIVILSISFSFISYFFKMAVQNVIQNFAKVIKTTCDGAPLRKAQVASSQEMSKVNQRFFPVKFVKFIRTASF